MAPYGAFLSDLTTYASFLVRLRLARAVIFALALLLDVPATLGQFRSEVDVVEVYATVSNTKGLPVLGLSRDDFIVREDGAAQQVATFSAGEFPLSVAIAVDRSFSMKGKRLGAAKSAARVFLGELRPADQSMVIGIGSTVDIVTPLSTDRASQHAALSRLDAFGTTGLHDSVIAAIDAIQQSRGRRALVLLSDGTDRFSTATATEALSKARSSDVLIYPVALGSERPAVFAELAALTGGRSFHIEDPARLAEGVRAIARELRSQYLLGYSPSKPIVPGSRNWRAISVEVKRPGVRVRARDGYVAR